MTGVVTLTEKETKLRQGFSAALVDNARTAQQLEIESHILINICKSNNECITYLVSLIADALGGDKTEGNVIFLLYLSVLLSKRGEISVNILTDYGSIMSFLVQHATSSLLPHTQALAMRCVTNISKYKSGKCKLPQMSGFLSYLCHVIIQGKDDEQSLFSIAVLSRLLELYENRSSFGQTTVCFGDTSFYDSIGAAATVTCVDSDSYMGHTCRLLLHLTRIEEHRHAIAQSRVLVSALQNAMQDSLEKKVTTLSSKFAVVSLMNLAGFPANRLLLANTEGLLLQLVNSAVLAGNGKTAQYCLAALLNLAWEGSNRALFMQVEGLLSLVVASIRGTDAKAVMYAVGILCNLTCVEEYQLVLGQGQEQSKVDVVGALVQAVKTGTGFTKDDAMGSLTNLSRQTLNRIVIATKLEQLQVIFDYIRTHHGVCRQRAVFLLHNLTTSFSSLDFFLKYEVEPGHNARQIHDMIKSFDKEQTIVSSLNLCMENFINRRKIIQESSLTSGSHTAVAPTPGQSGVQPSVSKEVHKMQLFEMLKKAKNENLKPQEFHQQHQTVSLPSGHKTHRFEALKKEIHDRALHDQIKQHSENDNNNNNSGLYLNNDVNVTAPEIESSPLKSKSAKVDVTRPIETTVSQSLEMMKKEDKEKTKASTVSNAQHPPQPQLSDSPQQLPECVTENITSPITRPSSQSKKKSTPRSNKDNSTSYGSPNDLNNVLIKSFISTRAPGSGDSSDESDASDVLLSKTKQSKTPRLLSGAQANSTAPRFNADALSRKQYDHDHHVAQPKKSTRKRPKDRKKSNTALMRNMEKGLGERKREAPGQNRQSRHNALASSEQYNTNQHMAHPPTSSRPSSQQGGGRGRLGPGASGRHVHLTESKATKSKNQTNHGDYYDCTDHANMLLAEEKSPTPPLFRVEGGQERKRLPHPARRLTYGEEDDAEKAQSKHVFGHGLGMSVDDKEGRHDAKMYLKPHKPAVSKPIHPEKNHHFFSPDVDALPVHSPPPPSGARRRSGKSNSKEPSTLHHFFFVKCYIDANRATKLVGAAEDMGISTPYLLKLAISEDSKTLEKMGMSSVDIMLTLKGLETIKI